MTTINRKLAPSQIDNLVVSSLFHKDRYLISFSTNWQSKIYTLYRISLNMIKALSLKFSQLRKEINKQLFKAFKNSELTSSYKISPVFGLKLCVITSDSAGVFARGVRPFFAVTLQDCSSLF